MLKNLTYFIIVILSFNSWSQEIETAKIDKLLTQYYNLGLNLNTSGWGVSFDYGFQKTFKYKRNS